MLEENCLGTWINLGAVPKSIIKVENNGKYFIAGGNRYYVNEKIQYTSVFPIEEIKRQIREVKCEKYELLLIC